MKNFCLVLAIVLLLVSAMSVGASAASEEEFDFPCGGVIKEVEVEILYAPLASRVSVGNFGPVITGSVLRVTYPDGSSEILTIEKSGDKYFAGDFSVRTMVWDIGKIIGYGFVEETVYLDYKFESHVDCIGEVDFVYLSLPSLSDIFALIDTYIRIIF